MRWHCTTLAVLVVAMTMTTSTFAQFDKYIKDDPTNIFKFKRHRESMELTEKQLKKIENMTEEAREEYSKAYEKAKKEYDRLLEKARQKYLKVANKAVDKVLTPKQKKRIWQIKLQYKGSRAIFDEEVQKAIGLNRKQRKALADAVAKKDKAMEIFRSRTKDSFKKGSKLYKEYQETLKTLLTDTQKRRLEALKGEPIFRRPEP